MSGALCNGFVCLCAAQSLWRGPRREAAQQLLGSCTCWPRTTTQAAARCMCSTSHAQGCENSAHGQEYGIATCGDVLAYGPRGAWIILKLCPLHFSGTRPDNLRKGARLQACNKFAAHRAALAASNVRTGRVTFGTCPQQQRTSNGGGCDQQWCGGLRTPSLRAHWQGMPAQCRAASGGACCAKQGRPRAKRARPHAVLARATDSMQGDAPSVEMLGAEQG